MIRTMLDADVTQVLPIEADLFQSPWNEEAFLYELHDNPFAHLFVLEEADEIIGYMDVWITFETAQLANLAVASHVQHLGHAKALMEHMIELCESAMCENITLEVRVDNENAKALYNKYGFIKAAIRSSYYEDGTDADLMIKPLGGNYV